MKILSHLKLLLAASSALWISTAAAQELNSTFYNPILPGWHSDPSCVHVNETFFCVSSTFISFPGLPIYASADLIDWKLVSHVWNRESQIPGASRNTTGQQLGFYAATLRYHDGFFYIACPYLGAGPDGILGLIFKTADPFDEASWSDPVVFKTGVIDPDLFWDDDGTVYIAQAGVVLQSIDLDTGALSPETPLSVWNGTGGNYPEGPHLYKKDDWYYLLIAEGGTELNHSITIARSSSVWGPYESYEGNPLLTAKGSDSLFQTVGHGDLFQDGAGNWWGAALSTRCGPEYEIYPMGRETVLYPATWAEGEWPVLDRVQGIMKGWPLPATSRDVPGDGPFNADPDAYDFLAAGAGATIPRNLVYWRVPREGAFSVTDRGLQIVPSRANLTGSSDLNLTGQEGLAFIGRRQTDTLFTYSVDVLFNPEGSSAEAETGITVFLTQYNHIDLGLVLVQPEDSSSAAPQLTLRLRAEAPYVDNPSVPPTEALAPVLVPVPSTWASNATITIQVQTANETHYRFSAWPAGDPNAQVVLGTASAQLVSGGSGTFVGTLIGAYATCNGAGEDLDCPDGGNAYIQNWQYRGAAQAISTVELVSSIISSS